MPFRGGGVTNVTINQSGEIDLSNVPANTIPMVDENGELVFSGLRRLDGGVGDLETDVSFIVPQESIQVGYSGILSALGAVPLFRSFVTGRRGTFPFTYWDRATGANQTVELSAAPNERIGLPNPATELIGSGLTFPLTTNAAEIISSVYFRIPTGSSITKFRARLTVEGQTEPFYYYPSRAGFESGEGIDFADTGNTPNEIMLDLENSPLFLLGIDDPNAPINVNVEFDFESGNVLGFNGVPFLEVDRNVVTLRRLLSEADIDADSTTTGLWPASKIIEYVRDQGNPPASTEPSFGSFSVDGVPRSVADGFQTPSSLVFRWTLMESANVDGDLTISQGSTSLTRISNLAQTSTLVPVSSTTLSSGQSLTWTISGRSTSGRVFSRSYTVRVPAAHESAYWDIRDTDDFATADVSTMTAADFTANTSFEAEGVVAPSHVLGALIPSNLDISRIESLGGNVLSRFVRTENVRIISGVSYHLYTLTNNDPTLSAEATYTFRRNE